MKRIVVNDSMQKGYTYILTEKEGMNFHPAFKPDLSPPVLLAMGVFGGKYMTDCREEFPTDWFNQAKLSPAGKNNSLNFYSVDASLPLSHWQEKGWIHPDDPRGWFQWYCRYYRGRRMPEEDMRQIKRWKAMKRHLGAIERYCLPGDLSCRRKQRQALLHWAYDARIV